MSFVVNVLLGLLFGIGLVVCVAGTVTTLAGGTEERRFGATGLVREVRQATRDFFDPNAAMAAGYGTAGSCVSGRKRGAMGLHFPNGTLVGDGELDAVRGVHWEVAAHAGH